MEEYLLLVILILVLVYMIYCRPKPKQKIIAKKEPIVNEQYPGKGFSTYFTPQSCSPNNNCFAVSYVRN